MSVDKLVDSTQLDADLTSVANAIRTRGGTSSQLAFPSGFASAVGAIGNIYTAGDEGKVVSSGALVSQTDHSDVTPTTSDQTIDTTTNNSIKVKGDANLIASNIKKDVVIFNITGSYEGSGGTPTVETGEYTPTTTGPTIQVSVSTTYTYFLVSVATKLSDRTMGSGGRRMVYAYGTSSWYVVEDMSDTGGSLYIVDRTSGGQRKITFTSSQITAKFLGSGTEVQFIAGQTYRWFAW